MENHLPPVARLAENDMRTKQTDGVCYLGPPHSYSHIAARNYFGDRTIHPVPTIGSVFDDVISGAQACGIVPIENSTDGRIVDTLSRLIEGRVQIVGEVRLAIHHCLLAQSVDGIKEIQSKPQALSQCRRYLASKFPDAIQTAVSSTTTAAAAAARDPQVAAVASREAGLALGLQVVASEIEDNPNNITRFVVIATESADRTGVDKTSLLFQVAHRPGSLADAMTIFKHRQLNLTFIESFPSPGEPDEYQFFVELDGHRDDEAVAAAIDQLQTMSHRLVVLGSYPKAK